MIQAAWLWYFKDHRSKSLLEHHLNNHLLLAHDQPFLRISLKSIHYFWVVFQWTDGRTDGWMDGCNRTIFLSLVFFFNIFFSENTLWKLLACISNARCRPVCLSPSQTEEANLGHNSIVLALGRMENKIWSPRAQQLLQDTNWEQRSILKCN